MRAFRGYIARRLFLSFGLLALLAALVTASSIRVVQSLSQTLELVQTRTQLSDLSVRIQVESLNLAEMLQYYTQATPDERPSIRRDIGNQETKLQDLVLKTKKLLAPSDVKGLEAIGNLENRVISFNYRANVLLDTVDQSTITSQDYIELRENHQQPLAQTTERFEQDQTARITSAYERARGTIQPTFIFIGFVAVVMAGWNRHYLLASYNANRYPIGPTQGRSGATAAWDSWSSASR